MTARGPAWPDAQEVRLIRAAVLDPEPASAAWRAWLGAGGRLDAVEGEAHRLLPQLWRNLAEAGSGDPDLARLAGVYRHAWVTNQRLLARAGAALGALAGDGIETMLLKGGALVTALRRGVGTRPMSDLDVLVRPREVPRAVDLLVARGYRPRLALPLPDLMRSRHALPLARDDGDQIDLHWSALPAPGDDELLWAAATPVRLGPMATRAPAPAHQLLLVCAHGIAWSAVPLRWVADAALVLRGGAEIDWAALVAAARDRALTRETAGALALLRDGFELPVPRAVVRELRATPLGRGDRLAARLLALRPEAPRLVLGWIDGYRRLRDRPYSALGPPPDLREHIRVLLGLPSRRALAPWLVRRSVRGLRARRARPRSGPPPPGGRSRR